MFKSSFWAVCNALKRSIPLDSINIKRLQVVEFAFSSNSEMCTSILQLWTFKEWNFENKAFSRKVFWPIYILRPQGRKPYLLHQPRVIHSGVSLPSHSVKFKVSIIAFCHIFVSTVLKYTQPELTALRFPGNTHKKYDYCGLHV